LNNNVLEDKTNRVKATYNRFKKKIIDKKNCMICFLFIVILSIISSSNLIPAYIVPFVIIMTPFLTIQIDKKIKEE